MKNYLFLLLLFWGNNCLLAQTKGFTTLPSGTERRFALVVGNKDYPHLDNLKNPINDAEDMSVALEKLGFEVTKVTNVDYRGFMGAVNRFKEKLTNSDVAFFYFSGHGASFGGKNYLLPTDTDTKCLEQIEEQGISLSRILGEISTKNIKNSFVVLDACRNLPKLRVCDNTKKDLFTNVGFVKPTNNPRGSLVVYATEEGSTADDNPKARNGLFTGALLKYLTTPNMTIKAILDKASLEVEDQSRGSQSPGRYDKIFGDFYFVISKVPPIPQPEVVSPTTTEVVPNHISPSPTPVKKTDLLPYEPAMVFVKGGTFQMGSNEVYSDEKPIHSVTLSDFYMGKYEVTQAQWEAVMGNNPSYFKNCPSCPVENVSWNNIQSYLEKLNKLTGKSYRLPTEAEWEYAARGGQASNGNAYSGSTTAENAGWNFDNSNSKTHEVGSKKGNELGIYDMTGNVWEWCNDWKGDYTASSQTNPTGASIGTDRVLRGGSWYYGPQYSRVANRGSNTPDAGSSNIGFRVVFPSESK